MGVEVASYKKGDERESQEESPENESLVKHGRTSG